MADGWVLLWLMLNRYWKSMQQVGHRSIPQANGLARVLNPANVRNVGNAKHPPHSRPRLSAFVWKCIYMKAWGICLFIDEVTSQKASASLVCFLLKQYKKKSVKASKLKLRVQFLSSVERPVVRLPGRTKSTSRVRAQNAASLGLFALLLVFVCKSFSDVVFSLFTNRP